MVSLGGTVDAAIQSDLGRSGLTAAAADLDRLVAEGSPASLDFELTGSSVPEAVAAQKVAPAEISEPRTAALLMVGAALFWLSRRRVFS
jgi:hypothetical protein